jgi:hypothetical protein
MPVSDKYRLVLGQSLKAVRLPARAERRTGAATPVKPTIAADTVVRALKRTRGADAILKERPHLADVRFYFPVATFSVCLKTGTAAWLDIWDADHFDGFTDMQRCVADCRAWFSADGFTYWDSPQTKTGRINCYFRAPSAGNYVCNAQLQSYGGPAVVECLIDSFSFGNLPFNGSVNQPHPCSLSAGYHHFRIRQKSGAFFFISLTVWRA